MRGFQDSNTVLAHFQCQSPMGLLTFQPTHGKAEVLYAHFLRSDSPNVQPHYPSHIQSTNVPCLSYHPSQVRLPTTLISQGKFKRSPSINCSPPPRVCGTVLDSTGLNTWTIPHRDDQMDAKDARLPKLHRAVTNQSLKPLSQLAPFIDQFRHRPLPGQLCQPPPMIPYLE